MEKIFVTVGYPKIFLDLTSKAQSISEQMGLHQN